VRNRYSGGGFSWCPQLFWGIEIDGFIKSFAETAFFALIVLDMERAKPWRTFISAFSDYLGGSC